MNVTSLGHGTVTDVIELRRGPAELGRALIPRDRRPREKRRDAEADAAGATRVGGGAVAAWRGRRGLRAVPGADGRRGMASALEPPGRARPRRRPDPGPLTSSLRENTFPLFQATCFAVTCYGSHGKRTRQVSFTRLVLFSLIRSPLCQPCDLARTVPSIRSVLFSALRFYESTKSNFFSKPKAGTRRCRAGSHLWVCRQTLGRNGPGSMPTIGMQKFSILSLPPESRLVGHAGRARYQKEVLLSAGRA